MNFNILQNEERRIDGAFVMSGRQASDPAVRAADRELVFTVKTGTVSLLLALPLRANGDLVF